MKKLRYRELEEEPVKRIEFGPGPVRGIVASIAKQRAGSLDEIHVNYVLQYLVPEERKKLANAAFKALKVGGKLSVIVPIWSAHKAYQDIDVAWPPVGEGWFQVLNKGWRDAQPFKLNGYECDFDLSLVYGMHQSIMPRNAEYQQTAIVFWKEAAQDIHSVLTKR